MQIIKYRLKTLSPVHIRHGLQEPKTKREAGRVRIIDKPETYKLAFFEQDGIVFRVDQKALQRVLLSMDRFRCRLLNRDRQEFVFVRAYADYCADEREPSIRGFLPKLADLSREIELKWEEEKFLEVIKARDQQGINVEQGSFISGSERDSFYIPGSSIKGALRTAVLYRILCREGRIDELVDQAQYRIDYVVAEEERQRDPWKPRDPRFSEERVKEHMGWIDSLFRQITPLDPTGKPLPIGAGEGAFKDLMKAVYVSDSSRLKVTARGRQVAVLVNRNGVLQEEDYRLVARWFKGSCEVEIGVDETMLARFRRALKPSQSLPFQNVEDVIACAEEFAQTVWKAEQTFFSVASGGMGTALRGFYNKPERPTLRLGWGSGLLGTTMMTLLPEAPIRLREKLRDKVIATDGKKHGPLAPASRRVVLDAPDTPAVPLGWVQLELLRRESWTTQTNSPR